MKILWLKETKTLIQHIEKKIKRTYFDIHRVCWYKSVSDMELMFCGIKSGSCRHELDMDQYQRKFVK